MYQFIFDFLCYHVRFNMKKKNRTSGILYHKYYHDIVCKKELFRLLNRGVFKRSEFQLAPEFGCTKTNKLPPEFVCTKLNKSFNVPNQGLLPGIILSNKFSFEFYWLSKLFSRSLTNDGTNLGIRVSYSTRAENRNPSQ